LRLFENWVLRRIFGREREREWREAGELCVKEDHPTLFG